jgi:hypothetical protein
VSAGNDLARLEAIVDACGVAQRIEALLPVGVRARQLSVRTLLIGMLAALADGRPAHLVRVHRALIGLSEAEQWRLGVIVAFKSAPTSSPTARSSAPSHWSWQRLPRRNPTASPPGCSLR